MVKYLIFFITLFGITLFFLFTRLAEFEFSNNTQQQFISLKYQQNILAGTLVTPPNTPSPPVVILIHGDGPTDRWSENGYMPLAKYLVSQGIAVFSWDKQGVGESTGNWLAQTMSDRADEAAFILQNLKKRPEFKKSKIGYLGFSQAGWVVPHAAKLANADFIALIGSAINWRNQDIYFTKQRLKLENVSTSEIEKAIKNEAETFDHLFTQESVTKPCSTDCNRQDFERRNALADAQNDITEITMPTLILMGEDDRNVDPNETVTIYNKLLPSTTPRCIKQLPNATHGLLKSEWFDYQLSSQWPLWKQGLFLLYGPYAYSPKALSTVTDWVLEQKCE